MPLVTVKDKFQVTIPAKVRQRVDIRVGDLLEATVHRGGILLRPKAVVDRDSVANELETVLRNAPLAAADQGKSESVILTESIVDIASSRAHRKPQE